MTTLLAFTIPPDKLNFMQFLFFASRHKKRTNSQSCKAYDLRAPTLVSQL